MANRCPPETEKAILDYSLQEPTHGQVRTSSELKKLGAHISASGVRSVWPRHQIENKAQRLKRLEMWSKEENNILSEAQVRALELQKVEKEAQGEIETHHSGFLVAQDTYYVGHIKGIGKIYQQTGYLFQCWLCQALS